jgi:protocatechuate 3,4-dioxygenase beta subunit
MRKNLILAGGALGLLILVGAVFDPLGWFSKSPAPSGDDPALSGEQAPEEAPPEDSGEVKSKRVVAMNPDGSQAKDVVFFARTGERVERVEAGRGWARIPLAAEQRTPIAALALSTWSTALQLPTAGSLLKEDIELDLLTDAADLELAVSIEGVEELSTPRARLHPLGEDDLAAAANLYLDHLSTGSFMFFGKEGKLKWRDLPPGAYEIELIHEDCVSQILRVRLQEGQPLTMPVVLQRGSGISGSVASADDLPLVNAQVALWQATESGALNDPLLAFRTYGFFPSIASDLRTETADDGTFRFENVAPGEWTVLVHATGYRPLIMAQSLQTVSGETAKTGALKPAAGFSLTLQLVSANGQPVADAEVRWMKRPPSGRALPERPNSPPSSSDSNGLCQLPGLPDGRLHLQIVHQDFAVVEQALDIQQDPPTPSTVEIVLHAGRNLSGRVLDILTEEPVAGVNLKILPRLGAASTLAGFGPAFKTEIITDAEGAFHFSSLPPDEYLLLAHHADYAQTLSAPIGVGEGHSQETVLHISPGAELSVELLDTNGAPLPEAWVIALGEEHQDFRRQQTDAQGVARFSHMAAGTYKVMQAESVAQATGKSGRLHRDYEYCSLMDLENRHVLLGGREIFSTLEGFVLLGGKAVSGRRIVLLADDGTRIATSDKSGFYQFEDLVPGNYLFQVTNGASSLGGSFFGSVLVTNQEITTRDVVLPAAELEVHIFDARGGNPIGQIPINIRPADGTAVAGGQFQSSNEQGVATFSTLRPGRYLVCAGEAAMPFFGGTGMFGAKMIEVEIPADLRGVQRLDLRLPRSASFTANTRDPQGRPLANVHLHYENSKGQILNRMSMIGSNANGFVELRGLPPGVGTIVARHPSFGMARLTVDLVEGQRTSRTISLSTGALAYVQTTNKDGRPLTGVIATLVTADGTPIDRLSTMEEAQQTRLAYLRGIEQKLGPLLPGRYSVKMFRPGEKPRYHPLEVLPNERDQHLRLIY